jgi:outer membrane protein assembly factor BamA
VRSGLNVTGGRPLFNFSRLFLTYGYEVVDTAVSPDLLAGLDSTSSVGVPVFNPFLDEGRHIESRVTPSFVHNTVDNPFTPRSGRKVSLNLPSPVDSSGHDQLCQTGRGDRAVRPAHEANGARRTAQRRLRAPVRRTRALPYYLRYFLGGEYQIRGVDIRTVGPDRQSEPRARRRQVRARSTRSTTSTCSVPFARCSSTMPVRRFRNPTDRSASSAHVIRRGAARDRADAERAVPLIYAWNTYRDVFQPARTFKFAVGTTF